MEPLRLGFHKQNTGGLLGRGDFGVGYTGVEVVCMCNWVMCKGGGAD